MLNLWNSARKHCLLVAVSLLFIQIHCSCRLTELCGTAFQNCLKSFSLWDCGYASRSNPAEDLAWPRAAFALPFMSCWHKHLQSNVMSWMKKLIQLKISHAKKKTPFFLVDHLPALRSRNEQPGLGLGLSICFLKVVKFQKSSEFNP